MGGESKFRGTKVGEHLSPELVPLVSDLLDDVSLDVVVDVLLNLELHLSDPVVVRVFGKGVDLGVRFEDDLSTIGSPTLLRSHKPHQLLDLLFLLYRRDVFVSFEKTENIDASSLRNRKRVKPIDVGDVSSRRMER